MNFGLYHFRYHERLKGYKFPFPCFLYLHQPPHLLAIATAGKQFCLRSVIEFDYKAASVKFVDFFDTAHIHQQQNNSFHGVEFKGFSKVNLSGMNLRD